MAKRRVRGPRSGQHEEQLVPAAAPAGRRGIHPAEVHGDDAQLAARAGCTGEHRTEAGEEGRRQDRLRGDGKAKAPGETMRDSLAQQSTFI